MQMIDVLKRLAELDVQNPRVASNIPVLNKVNESQVDECGMMGMGEMHPPMQPSTPASINMTAGSADELGNLLKDIVSLAGMKSADAAPPMADPAPDASPPPAEPEMGPPESPADSMRSVIDKLNPMAGDDEQDGADDGADDVPTSHGDIDNDGDHDMDDHDAEKKEKSDEEYDNTPADPNKPPPFDSNKMSNQDPAGAPGAGDRMDGDRPRAFATFEDQLMWEYKKYIRG